PIFRVTSVRHAAAQTRAQTLQCQRHCTDADVSVDPKDGVRHCPHRGESEIRSEDDHHAVYKDTLFDSEVSTGRLRIEVATVAPLQGRTRVEPSGVHP